MSTTDRDGFSLVRRGGGPAPVPADALDADQVAAWLADNPEFLTQRADLLLRVETPSRFAGGDDRIVDFQQVMIRRLKAEADRQARFGRALIQAGESNQDAQSRIHAAVLTLVEARGFDGLLAALSGPVAAELGLTAIAIGVEAPEGSRPPARLSAVAALAPGSVDRLIGPGRAVRLRAMIDREQGVPPGPFGPRAREIRSDALVRLALGGPVAPPALLALGATNPEAFHPDQGTDLLVFLGGVVERLIGQWLDLPPG